MPNLTEDKNNDFENSMARDALEKVKTFQNSHDLKVNFFSLLRALEVGCQGEYFWIPALHMYIAPNSDYDCCRFSEVQTNVKERVPKMAEAGGSAGCEYEEEGYDGGWEEEEIEEKVV